MRRAFTLIELLVVISIIALLIAILLPVLSSVRYESKNFLCVNRQRSFVQGTAAFAVDNDGFYPDRGFDLSAGSETLWARWAMRSSVFNTPTDDFYLDVILQPYIGKEVAVWCCPLYDGEHSTNAAFGCLTHGRGHRNNLNINLNRYTTYSYHGGLVERTNSDFNWLPGDRLKYGDPYVVINNSTGERYESGLLMSDNAAGDNGWVPIYDTSYGTNGAIITQHQPPTASESQRISNPAFRTLAVTDKTYLNFAYDDGSAEARTITPSSQLANSDEWKLFNLGGGRSMIYPD